MVVFLIDTSNIKKNMGLYLRHSSLEPIGLEYLASSISNSGYEVRIINTTQKGYRDLRFITDYKNAIVGLSVMTYSLNHALRIVRNIKRINAHIITVLGGYHPSACPEIVIDENIDFVVIGEGERTFTELLEAINSKSDIKKVKGVAYWTDGLHINEPRERIENLDELPFPLRHKKMLEECKIGGLSYPSQSQQKSVCQITYSRGCPYDCTYCCSPQLWKGQVRWRTAKNLADEIECLQRDFDTNMLFFTDLTFNLSTKKVYELCNETKQRDIKTNWFAMCRFENIDSSLLAAMKTAGCTKISFGLEATNTITLSKIKPHPNININTICEILKQTSETGIITKTYIMIGYPWETKQDLLEAKKFVSTLSVDELRIGILTPLPGSALYKEFKREGLLLHEDYSKYTTEECVIKLKDMTPEELYEIREQIFREFYRSKEYEKRMKEKIRKYPHLKQSYDEFFEFLHKKGILK